MAGDEWMWFVLAYQHLHCPVWLAKKLTPIAEFQAFKIFYRENFNRPEKTEYYLAQITAELRRQFVRDARRPRLEDFLSPVKMIEAKKPKLVDEKDELKKTKAMWFAAVGLNSDGSSRKKAKSARRHIRNGPRKPARPSGPRG
jgi:hypothetical protein